MTSVKKRQLNSSFTCLMPLLDNAFKNLPVLLLSKKMSLINLFASLLPLLAMLMSSKTQRISSNALSALMQLKTVRPVHFLELTFLFQLASQAIINLQVQLHAHNALILNLKLLTSTITRFVLTVLSTQFLESSHVS